MPRGRDDMQVNVAGLRRNIKNLAHNYSDAQVKVREATSNDPWGPSSTLMAEIADLTYNVMAFTEIMQMIWKRLNDHGKNWRHVYKALVLMEYLIKTGSEKVAMQCKENIYAIHTLKDFQYMEEGKDQGLNVREKAKQLVTLLKDDERLKNERARALKAKQRFAQSASAFGSDGALDTPTSPSYPALSESSEWGASGGGGGASAGGGGGGREAELARPLTAGEEELQLQLALAMSREEAEREERRKRSDDVRLQLAISQSQHDFQLQEHLHRKFLRLPPITEETYPNLSKTWPFSECPHAASNSSDNSSSRPVNTSVRLNYNSESSHSAGDYSQNTSRSPNASNDRQNASEWSYYVNNWICKTCNIAQNGSIKDENFSNWPHNTSNVAQNASNEHKNASEWSSNAINLPQDAIYASEWPYNSDWPYSTSFTPQYTSSELNASEWSYNACNILQNAKNEQQHSCEWYYPCHMSQKAKNNLQNPREWSNNAYNLPQNVKNGLQNAIEWANNANNAENKQENTSEWSDVSISWPCSVQEEAISCECSQLPDPNHWLCKCLQCQQQNVQDPEDAPTKRAEPAQQSHLLDLLDVNLSPSNGVSSAAALVDPWGVPSPPQRPDTSGDAWSAVNSPARDPWAPTAAAPPPDPWAPTLPHLTQSKSPASVLSSPSSSELEQFDALSRRPLNNNHEPDNDPFDLTGLGSQLSPMGASTGAIKKSPSAFLGENSALVNLERLLQPAAPAPPHNPFAEAAPPPAPAPAPRQFAPTQPAKLTINELKQQQMGLSFPAAAASGVAGGVTSQGADPWGLPARTASPWSPQNTRHTPNPFLS